MGDDHRPADAEQRRPAGPLVVEDVADPPDTRLEQQVGEAAPKRAAELAPEQVEDLARQALEELDDDVAEDRVADDDVGQVVDDVLALDVADEVECSSRRSARSRAGSERRPCPSPRRSRAGRRAGSATPRTRSAKIAPIRAYWARFSAVESGFAPMSRRTIGPASVVIWTARAGRSTPGRRPSRRTAAAMPGAGVAGASRGRLRGRCFTRSVATMIVESFFSRRAFAGCSSIPMTSEAWTISTFGGRSPASERIVASSPTRRTRSSGWARA